MAQWYCGSVQYAAVAQWAATTAYVVGDLRRQLATPATGSERVFRCTTLGVSGAAEPTWTLTKGATTNDGTAVWTEVTGNSAYGWSAAAATVGHAVSWMSTAGDITWLAKTHTETRGANYTITPGVNTANNPTFIISVDPAGSVPPVTADEQAGASVGTSGTFSLTINTTSVWKGVTFVGGSGASAGGAILNISTSGDHMVFDICVFSLPITSGASRLTIGSAGSGYGDVRWVNTTFTVGAVGNFIQLGSAAFTWNGTSSGVTGATIPTTLLVGQGTVSVAYIDGIDFSNIGSGKTLVSPSNGLIGHMINCKVNASVTLSSLGTPAITSSRPCFDFIQCDSGADLGRHQRQSNIGTQSTERTIVKTGGASDPTGALSSKVVTGANANRANPFELAPITIDNQAVGSSKTITIETVTDNVTLKDEEWWAEVLYLGTSGSVLASLVTSRSGSLITNIAGGSNIATSTATWTTTGLTTPVKQKLVLTFTPQVAGDVRVNLFLRRASTTVYVDPDPKIT